MTPERPAVKPTKEDLIDIAVGIDEEAEVTERNVGRYVHRPDYAAKFASRAVAGRYAADLLRKAAEEL